MSIILKKGKYISPYKNIITELHKKEITEEDFFKLRSVCPIGAIRPTQNYDKGNVPENELVGWNISKYEHTKLGVIADAGTGKTRLIKNIINSYHKQKFKILVFSPKADEWSSAKRKGNGKRLHKFMKNESLPIVSYCPSYVKHYLEINDEPTTKYKFYSHSIKHFTSKEVWESLGFSATASSFAVGQINQGVRKLREMQRRFKTGNINPISRNSALEKIETMMNTKFSNDRLNELDLEGEWERDNIIALNYFSQKGFIMESDVWIVCNKVREYCQKKRRRGDFQPVLILFDDANYYGAKSCGKSVSVILDCLINWRSLGVNCIVSYQFPEVVDDEIHKGCANYLVSYIPDPGSLNGIFPPDAIDVIRKPPRDNGLLIDKKTYTAEWIWKPSGRDWYRFFPFDCIIGHE